MTSRSIYKTFTQLRIVKFITDNYFYNDVKHSTITHNIFAYSSIMQFYKGV